LLLVRNVILWATITSKHINIKNIISKQAPPPRKKVDYGSSSLKAEVKAKARRQETLEAAGGEFSLILTAKDLTERVKRRTRISR